MSRNSGMIRLRHVPFLIFLGTELEPRTTGCVLCRGVSICKSSADNICILGRFLPDGEDTQPVQHHGSHQPYPLCSHLRALQPERASHLRRWGRVRLQGISHPIASCSVLWCFVMSCNVPWHWKPGAPGEQRDLFSLGKLMVLHAVTVSPLGSGRVLGKPSVGLC